MRRTQSERPDAMPSPHEPDRIAAPPPSVQATAPPDFAALAGCPRQACGSRGFWAKVTCYDRMCREPAWSSSADCIAFRERVQAARQRALSE
jgi:hypothetical protein